MVAACGQEVGQCHGFCLDDAAFDAVTEQPSGCIGFYPTDATFDVSAADADADANVNADANADADDAAHE